MVGRQSSSPGAGAPGAVVVAAAVAVGLVVGAGGLMAVLLLRERGNKAVAGVSFRVWWTGVYWVKWFDDPRFWVLFGTILHTE